MPAPTRKTKAKPQARPEPKPANEEIRFGRYFLLSIVILIGVVFFKMISMFLIPIILAAVFSGLFYGFFEKLSRRLRGRRGISAGLCCLLLLLLLLIPLYFLGSLVAEEALDFYDSAEVQVKEIIAQGDQGLLGRLSGIPLLQRLGLDRIDWQASLQDVFKGAASLIASVINTATKSTFNVIANLFFTLFAMFYFFKDGDRLIAYVKKFSPLPNEYEDQLIRRFLAVSRGTIKGTMLIGLIKGIIGGLTFWIFGIRSPILWGVIMAILSLIPMVGAWLVMYPAAFVLMVTGQVWQGVLLFLIAAVLVGNIDNVLQPILVGRETGLHDLLIFFSSLGGIAMFGVMGFLIGPIIAAFFLTVLDFYAIEFRNQLAKAKKDEEQG